MIPPYWQRQMFKSRKCLVPLALDSRQTGFGGYPAQRSLRRNRASPVRGRTVDRRLRQVWAQGQLGHRPARGPDPRCLAPTGLTDLDKFHSQSLRGAETVGRAGRGYDAARRSTAVNVTSPSTPADRYSPSWSPADTFKTVTAPGPCSGRCTPASGHPAGLGRFRLRRPTRRLGRHPAQAHRADRGQTRRPDHLRRAAPSDGRPSAPFPGSTDAAAPSATMNGDLSTTPRWSNRP